MAPRHKNGQNDDGRLRGNSVQDLGEIGDRRIAAHDQGVNGRYLPTCRNCRCQIMQKVHPGWIAGPMGNQKYDGEYGAVHLLN